MDSSNPLELALLKEAYACQECAAKKRSFASKKFEEARPGFFYKFPPLIGGSATIKLLFVGYNPRRTKNVAIHNYAIGSIQNFCTLSNNVDHHGQPYIGSPKSAPDHEEHYELHNDIVQRVFAKPFNDVAAVTEMFLCASKNGGNLHTEKSPCAQKFLLRTIGIADPD